MIFLFHGEDAAASRDALVKLKNRYDPDAVVSFDAAKVERDAFFTVLESVPLFAEKGLVAVEGELTRFDAFPSARSSADIAFWSGTELSASSKLLKFVKDRKGEVKNFKEIIPRNIFTFLDALSSRDKRKSFLECHRLLDAGEAPLYILTMIAWQMRNLLCFKLSSPHLPKLKPFVRGKLSRQAPNFAEKELVGIMRRILLSDVALKTTPLPPVLVIDGLVELIT